LFSAHNKNKYILLKREIGLENKIYLTIMAVLWKKLNIFYMANLLWGRVYYKEHFAGFLREEPGQRASFTYDENYLEAGHPAIAHTLPLRSEPYLDAYGLHPFFDNLVAEGWLEDAQQRLLGKRQISRFELLLAFGQDCAGAVSILDPEPVERSEAMLDLSDPKELAMMTSRASLSGIQPKLVLVEREGALVPSRMDELSTHIVKFPSRHHNDLVVNEYLSTLAFKGLLPGDDVVSLWLGEIAGFSEQALIIKRFDRDANGERIHFEEFNQLLGKNSRAKYDGSYKDMADFIDSNAECLSAEKYRLFLRILAGLLIGNTDMHFKNFAMFHTDAGLRLTPSYDQLAAAIYQYKTIALTLGGGRDIQLGNLKANNIIKLSKEFGLSEEALMQACEQLAENKASAKEAVLEAEIGTMPFKNQIIDLMEKRWNGTFALIGKRLSKKR